jgi:hypothetical protein
MDQNSEVGVRQRRNEHEDDVDDDGAQHMSKRDILKHEKVSTIGNAK